ncbi:MAG: inositol monophosphatase family protein [bacterium]
MAALEPAQLLAVAEDAARQAGEKLSRAFGSEVVVNEAHHHDLKIQLDVETQQLLTKIILQRFPDHAILGEEGGEGSSSGGYEWILDPLDGTVNFAYGIPHFCVSVACRYQNAILAGVILDPMRRECFTAFKGGGARCNGRPIRVSSRSRLEEAIMALGFSKGPASINKCLELYQFYGHRARKLRAMGSAALDMAYIASGRLDVYIEQGIKIWDIAAGMVILEEAGGNIILTPHPEPHHFHICASNGLLELVHQ